MINLIAKQFGHHLMMMPAKQNELFKFSIMESLIL
ncbi:hypothetical protein SAMN05518871_1141, partial [Psychrobacillus sp. OK028]